MHLNKANSFVEAAISLSRLSDACLKMQAIGLNSFLVYRLLDDYSLDESQKLLREHIVVAVSSSANDQLLDFLDDWGFRYGVASVTIVGDSFSEDMRQQFTRRYFRYFEYEQEQDYSPASLRFCFDAPPINRISFKDVAIRNHLRQSLGLEAFKFLAEAYAQERIIIDLEPVSRGRYWSWDGVTTYTHTRERIYKGRDSQYKSQYRCGRISLERLKRQAEIFTQQLSSNDYKDYLEWDRELLLEALKALWHYVDQVLYSTNILDAANTLSNTLDNLRTENSLRSIISLLESEYILDVREYLQLIRIFRGTGAINALTELFTASEKEVRNWVIETVSVMGSALAVPILESALNDPNNYVRLAAIHGLGTIGGISASEALISYLNRIAPNIEQAAIDALFNTGTSHVFDFLLNALASEQEELIKSILWNIGSVLHTPGYKELVQESWENLSIETKASIMKQFSHHLKDTSFGESSRTYIALFAVAQERQAVQLFAKMMDSELEFEIAYALAEIGGEESAQLLLDHLKEHGNDVNWMVVRSVGLLKVHPAVSTLIDMLREEKGHVSEIVEALGEIGNKAAAEAIFEAYEKNPNLGEQAISALSKLGRKELADSISTKQKDNNKESWKRLSRDKSIQWDRLKDIPHHYARDYDIRLS